MCRDYHLEENSIEKKKSNSSVTKCGDSVRDYVDDFTYTSYYTSYYIVLVLSTSSDIKNKAKLKKDVTQNKKLTVKDGAGLSRIDR